MPYEVVWNKEAGNDLDELFAYLVEHASLWDAENVSTQALNSTRYLARFPRLYEAAPQYGKGIRRISVAGRVVLYKVDDRARIVRVVAVVGGRSEPRKTRRS